MEEITIYTKPTCPYCAAAKEDFEKKGLKYTEIDVTASDEALAEMEKISGGSRVPVIVKGGEVTIGFGGA